MDFGDVHGGIKDSELTGRDRAERIYHQYFYRQPLANEAIQPHSFDLEPQMRACGEICLEREQGLVGFLLEYNSPLLLKNFCQRLHNVLGRNTVSLPSEVFSIDHIRGSVLDVVKGVKKRLPRLAEKDLLISVSVEKPKTVEQLWGQLQQECRTVFEHRLIVIIGLPQQTNFPLEGLVKLEPPRFEKVDFFLWLNSFINALNWPNLDLIKTKWQDMMFRECSKDNHLDIDKVYSHLNFVLEELQENPAAEVFLDRLHTWCEI